MSDPVGQRATSEDCFRGIPGDSGGACDPVSSLTSSGFVADPGFTLRSADFGLKIFDAEAFVAVCSV